MIYIKEIPETLQQGDVLQNLPKITPNQINFELIKEHWIKSINSEKLPEKISFKVAPLLANGVILSQSCDIRPKFSILFAELKVLPHDKLSHTNLKKRIRGIKNIIRDDTRIHYFPPANEIELFKEPKLLDFKNLFLVPYEFFQENLEKYYVASLKDEAQKVLCEKIARFFTRFAFEDIIFLKNEEQSLYLESLTGEDKNNAIKTLEKLK